MNASISCRLNPLWVAFPHLFQIQDVDFVEDKSILYDETLPALQKLKSEGKIRFIGITGYDLEIIKQVIVDSSIKIDTVLSPCHCTLNDVSVKDYAKFFEVNWKMGRKGGGGPGGGDWVMRRGRGRLSIPAFVGPQVHRCDHLCVSRRCKW